MLGEKSNLHSVRFLKFTIDRFCSIINCKFTKFPSKRANQMSLFVVKSAMERAEGRRFSGGGWSSKG